MKSLLLNGVILLWFTETVLSGQWTATSPCRPAEEGTEHTLTFTGSFHRLFHYAIVYIIKNEFAVSACLSPRDCKDFQSAKYRTSSVMDTNSSDIKITLRIYNVSRDLEKDNKVKWYLVTNETESQVMGRCTVVVFSKVKNIYHREMLLDNALHLLVWSSHILTEATCDWNSSLKVMQELILKSVTNHTIEIIHQKPILYRTNCTLVVPWSLLTIPGRMDVSVLMYPNVTGNDEDKTFGISESIYINLDYPSVKLTGCRNIVEENTEVTCKCERSDTSLVNGSIVWYDDSRGENVVNNGSQVLSYMANRTGKLEHNVTFYCRAINRVGLENENSTKKYTATIIARVKSITCATEYFDDVYTVACSAERVYPPALCRFHIKHIHTGEEAMSLISYVANTTASVIHTNKPIPGDPIYYNSTCILLLPRRSLSQAIYDVLVTMYPNVTGGETDSEISTYKLISVAIEQNTSVTQGVTPLAWPSGPGVLTFVVGGNALILAIMFAVIFRQLKGRTPIYSNYDEIGDHYRLTVNHGNELYDEDGYRRVIIKSNERVDVGHEYESIEEMATQILRTGSVNPS